MQNCILLLENVFIFMANDDPFCLFNKWLINKEKLHVLRGINKVLFLWDDLIIVLIWISRAWKAEFWLNFMFTHVLQMSYRSAYAGLSHSSLNTLLLYIIKLTYIKLFYDTLNLEYWHACNCYYEKKKIFKYVKWTDECERIVQHNWQYVVLVCVIKVGRTENWME